MARYTDEFRANSVIMLEMSGYPDKPGALMETAKYLKIPHATLSRWYNGKRNPPPSEMVQIKKETIVDLLKSEIGAALKEMINARQDADYKELATAIGIMIDKMQLLDGKPTDRAEIIDDRLTDEERVSRVAAILERARARRDGRTTDDGRIH